MREQAADSLWRAQALAELGRHDQARMEIGRLLAENPESPDALCVLAECELRLGDAAEARRVASSALALDPESDAALRLHAVSSLELGDRAAAVRSARAAVRATPEDAVTRYTLGQVLVQNAEAPSVEVVAEARDAADRAVELAPGEPAPYVLSGLAAGAAGDRRAERAAYEQALRLDPHDTMALNNLAAMDIRRARLGRGARRVVAALREDPQEGRLYAQRHQRSCSALDDFDPMTLPEAAAWRRSHEPPPSLQDYVAEQVSVSKAVSVSTLIVPTFILNRGCILVRMLFEEESFFVWWKQLNGNKQEIEKMINHLHLWDLFDVQSDQEEQALWVLVEQMSIGWHAKASKDFPDRDFRVLITDEYGPTRTIYSPSQES
ncbi:tetratricopeptide repeat protein [Prauserella shujinwangii]|uniref:Tetratricopeptide repeat protein n=1 Tax=Prauserella shujinwangii TaxID=1453103 RepID=A0A2T0LZ46_9PSEU|nr:tetratricopeptide repeat protein [Prauserella shujinwangii]PRX49391.1 tetratricopeptide repeat protein [Prauserella shujinwangii]